MSRGLLIRRSGVRIPAGPLNESETLHVDVSSDTVSVATSQTAVVCSGPAQTTSQSKHSARTVAALYIDPRGPYPKMPGVDCWDAERDAENYAGPWPVVAHPPCGPWGKLRHLYSGNEAPLGLVAFMHVRRWGGVLEQPAGSRLFAAAGAPPPGGCDDAWGGTTMIVNQCDWGHVARKPTWVYRVGVDTLRIMVPEPREPTHWCSGGRTKRPGMGAAVPPGIKVCSAQQRRRTPPAFAEWLVALARSVSENALTLRPGAPYPDGPESQ